MGWKRKEILWGRSGFITQKIWREKEEKGERDGGTFFEGGGRISRVPPAPPPNSKLSELRLLGPPKFHLREKVTLRNEPPTLLFWC